jgi:pre-mRNA-splicing factor CDC5/CEF1
MKIYIRGGAWSNVEDQVLLAAYMKYGGNEWRRIASLLPKKSVSQVKARWEEYLDPTIRKSPWTAKEDEKLLRLAQLMPMQWRTIGQYFGRTAHQCLERYRELIDTASGTPHVRDNDAAVAHDYLPNFETWDAVPDPVDMDQESKEMLAEARARLANTQGKKARRKARERQLDVLRKVTARRKARELESLGLVLAKKNVWEDEEFEMDVITTHTPKAVKFDTADDDLIAKKEKVRRIKQRIAQRKREERPLDAMKVELRKEEAKLATPFRMPHGDLVMPEPQVHEDEYRNIEWLRRFEADFLDEAHELSLLRVNRKRTAVAKWEMERVEFVSQPVQRGLPRPCPVSAEVLWDDFESVADRLIVEELLRLAVRDAKQNPQRSRPPRRLVACLPVLEEHLLQFEDVSEQEIATADALIREEMGDGKIDIEEFTEAWDAAHGDLGDERLEDRIARREKKVDDLRKRYEEGSKVVVDVRAALIGRANALGQENSELERRMELLQRIADAERGTLDGRIDAMRERVAAAQKEHHELDQQYAVLIEEEKERKRAEKAKSRKAPAV